MPDFVPSLCIEALLTVVAVSESPWFDILPIGLTFIASIVVAVVLPFFIFFMTRIHRRYVSGIFLNLFTTSSKVGFVVLVAACLSSLAVSVVLIIGLDLGFDILSNQVAGFVSPILNRSFAIPLGVVVLALLLAPASTITSDPALASKKRSFGTLMMGVVVLALVAHIAAHVVVVRAREQAVAFRLAIEHKTGLFLDVTVKTETESRPNIFRPDATAQFEFQNRPKQMSVVARAIGGTALTWEHTFDVNVPSKSINQELTLSNEFFVLLMANLSGEEVTSVELGDK